MPTNDNDDVDLYGDLPEFNLEGTIQKLETENKKLTQTVKDLTSRVSELETQNNDLTRMNKNLKANISSLVKTVQGEIQRKDNTIAELRQEREDLFFRRQKPNGRGRPPKSQDADLKSQDAEAAEQSAKPDGTNVKEKRRRSTRQSASSADPSKQRGSLSEEPTQTSPQKTLRSNRRKEDPAKAVPAKADPAKAVPAKADPAKADPTKADPAKAVPAKADPAKADPAKADPTKADPAKADPAKADPTKADPAKTAGVHRLTPLPAQTNSLDDFQPKRPRRTASLEQAQESAESKPKVAEKAPNTPGTPQNGQAKEEVSSASPKKRARRTPTSRLYVKTRSSARISAKQHSSAQETSTDNADVSLLEALQLEERSQPAFTNSPLPDILSPFKDDRSMSPVSMPSAISSLLTGAVKPVEPSTRAVNPSPSTSTFSSIASLLTGALKPNQSSVSGGTPAPATPALPEVGPPPGSTPVTQVLKPVEPRKDTSSSIPKDPRKLPSACAREKVLRLGVLTYKEDPPLKGPQDVGVKKNVLRQDGLLANANKRDVPRREANARKEQTKQNCGKEEKRRETPESGVSREMPRKEEAQGTLQGGMARREEQKRGEEKEIRSERETSSKDKVLRKEVVTRREENLRRDEERRKEEAKLREEQHRKEEAKLREEQHRKEEATRREETLRKEEERRREEAKRREETVRKEEEMQKEEAKRREEQRVEEERRKEEAIRREEQHRKEEFKRKEEKHRIEEAKLKEEERRKEEAKRREEQHRKEEERRKEEARRREEQRRKEEERWEEEAKRREDIRKEEARRREEQHRKEEAKRIEEKHRIEEAKRKEEETRRKEEMTRKEDLSGKSENIRREALVSSSETRAKEASAKQINCVPDANKNGCLLTQSVSPQNDSGAGSKPRISLGGTQSDSSALQCDFRVRRRTRVQVKMIVNTSPCTPSSSGEAGTSPAVLASPTNKVAKDNRLEIVAVKPGLSKVVEKVLPIASKVVEKALPAAAIAVAPTEVPARIRDHSPRDKRYSRGSNEASPRQLPYKKPGSDFRHRARSRSRSRSRSPPRNRENLPPGRPHHRHSKGFRSPPRHRLSRKHDPRTHHLNFTRRSRSLSPRLCLQRRNQRKEERLPPKLPIDRKERERMLFGKSPDRSPRGPPQPRIITIMNVKRSKKANFQDSPDTNDFSSSHKPQGSTAANRLLSTPVYFRERHPDSNPGESDSESGAISSGTESSHSKDSDDSYRPKKRRRSGFDHAKRKSKKLCRGENR